DECCGDDEDVPAASPIRELAADQRRGDEDAGLGQCAEKYLLRYLGLSAADLLEQVVGLVGDQEGIGQDEHQAAGESPGEVWALPRIDVESAGELPQRQAGLSACASWRSFSVAAKSRTKNPPIAHGARNMASWLPVKNLTMKVPVTEATGEQTPRTPPTRPR